jgi:hypothetical protein
MAGILNSKERMIDFIITPQGRRQMADGRMQIEFATLTDKHTFYTTSDPDNVADDASSRVFFETYSSTTDTITPELDAGGDGTNLQAFRAGSLQIEGKVFAENTYNVSTGSFFNTLTGSQIIEKAGTLSQGIINHFKGLQILGTEDVFSNSSEFRTQATTGTFVITDQDLDINQGRGIYLKDLINPQTPEYDASDGDASDGVVELDYTPSIHADPRFSHLPNYKFMPPRNVPAPRQDKDDPSLVLGNYPNFSSAPDKTPLVIQEELIESLANRQNLPIRFTETSINNNMIAQMFEFSTQGVDKLSIIDHGIFQDNEGKYKHMFFLGKILNDSNESQTFMNIFTIVFEE